ncbi:asparagine synthase (glutamine-hydrolyzing) [Hominibacterium faecale]|uniref:asparagine synthase (glutamine-hydrolyzing) n=1 Tax=Hominibacterium faecale TaxID=2839743 RepID=UPI0022B29315|nr:asparagine synthase (glutamine-hydrolyzing) [Hominibacterium faecale]
MCGIAGIIGQNDQSIDQIRLMTDIIAHRGPDGEGHYIHDNVALGHRRLSIVDLTDNGRQPMEYMDQYVIVYNGEIYNYIELRDELIEQGYAFTSDCDTEVIMAAYDYWGNNCLNHFNGMWSFAILDKNKKVVFCSRDRYGVKPFYYMQLNECFIFASEIKQFTVFEDWEAVANNERLYDFLKEGILDHTNETLFENVFQLRGGEMLTYSLAEKSFEICCWYNLDDKVQNVQEEFNSEKKVFLKNFFDAVKLRLRSDVKVGSCLSGGLDSSSITCVANSILKEKNVVSKQETVSSCFNIKKYDEQEYIDEVTKKTGTINHKIFPKYKDLFEILDDLAWHQDEPFTSTSIFCQWNVFKEAKDKGIKVMLDGQGADEQLAGYGGFLMANFEGLKRRHKYKTLFREMNAYNRLFKSRRKNMLVSWIYSLGYAFMPLGIKNKLRKQKQDRNAEWLNEIYKGKDRKPYVGKDFGDSTQSILNHSLNQLKYTSLPVLLHYEDRNSMAHSIESRVPFLDYRIVERVLSLPDEYKICNSETKFILRKAMQGILPDKIVNRHDKLGFVSPEEVWIRENSEIFRNEISSACDYLQGFIDKKVLLSWFDEKLLNKKEFGYVFWKVISAGRWMKVFNVSIKL